MKKKIALLSLLCLAFCAVGLFGCGKAGGSDAEISGAKDVVLKSSDTTFDFSPEAMGIRGFRDGEPAEVSVDSSKVVFGTPGEYEVTYTLDDAKKTIKARVYGMPTISAQDAIQSYPDAVQWTVGVTATDSFGESLRVFAIEPELEVAGMPEYNKSYEVRYTATDRAGNVATASRTILVSRDNRPTFGSAEVTLTDTDRPVEVAGNLIAALDETGKVVNAFAGGADGKLYFSGEYFLEKGAGTYEFTLATTAGYNKFTVKVHAGDALGAILLEEDLTDYVFSEGERIRFPQAKSAPGNAYRYEYRYEIEDARGGVQAADMFAPVRGNYVYRVSARKSAADAFAVVAEQRFFVREETEALDLAISPKNLNFFSPNLAAGASYEFVEAVTIGGQTTPAYRFGSGTRNAETLDRVLQVDQEYLKKMIERGFTTFSVDVGTTEYAHGAVFLNVEFFGQYQTPNGGANYAWGSIGGGLIPGGGWQTYTFDLAKGFTSPSQPTVYTKDAAGEVIFTFRQYGLCFTCYSVYPTTYIEESHDFYLRNIRFGKKSNTELGDLVNTYKNGSDTIVLAENGQATVKGSSYRYELYGEDTVLFFSGANRLHDFSMTYTAGSATSFSNLNFEGADYTGAYQFEDGDVLTLGESGVSFDLPRFAERFENEAGFSYTLRRGGSQTPLLVKSAGEALGSYRFTQAGHYEWAASYPGGESYVYDLYVLAADDIFTKLKTTDMNGKTMATLRFLRMDGENPVFEVRGVGGDAPCLYLDGDFVTAKLAEEAASGEDYQLRILTPRSENQCYIMWDGQIAVPKGYAGCYANAGAMYILRPSYLAKEGVLDPAGKNIYPVYERKGEEDLRIEFKGAVVEISGLTYEAVRG